MSVAQLFMIGNWFFEFNFKNRFKKAFENKAFLVYISLFVIHIIGLIYTQDFEYALNDIRIKLPLFVIPFIAITSTSLSEKQIKALIIAFVLAVFAGTLISTYIVLVEKPDDIRNASIFISHILFSLNICLAIFFLIYFVVYEKYRVLTKSLFVLIALWLVVFLFLIKSMTGIGVLLIISLALFTYFIISHKNLFLKLSFIALTVITVLFLFFYLQGIVNELNYKENVDFSKLEKFTPRGSEYEHFRENPQTENGHYLWLYVCYPELAMAWNQRSNINFDSLDNKNQPVKFTLIRFLTSKGQKKDYEGVMSLSNEEIKGIENGKANIEYLKDNGIRNRIKSTIWEMQDYARWKDPRNHSFSQRVELWKTAISAIKSNWLFGVGTGDPEKTLDNELAKKNSMLKNSLLHCHNQYLSIFLTFGIIGFVIFLISIFYPPYINGCYRNIYFVTFLILISIAMLTEDTLETQAGATFYAFFSSFFIFINNKKN
jgi:O-antigen ligase